MNVIKQTIRVPATRELHIKLPTDALTDEEAEVIVLFKAAALDQGAKLVAMKSAMNDELFLADLAGTMNDFQHIDDEEAEA